MNERWIVYRERIVSLLPSATEIVYALGLGERLVGVTHERDFPATTRPSTSTRCAAPTCAVNMERLTRKFGFPWRRPSRFSRATTLPLP